VYLADGNVPVVGRRGAGDRGAWLSIGGIELDDPGADGDFGAVSASGARGGGGLRMIGGDVDPPASGGSTFGAEGSDTEANGSDGANGGSAGGPRMIGGAAGASAFADSIGATT
jgi:hypothetical protein